ncbi:MAG: methyltransferase [Candidatus Cloacimonadales bacterium]
MMDDEKLKENSKVIHLPDGSCIYQHREGQKISTDNVLLNETVIAYYSQQSASALQVLELGSGNGINSIMLKKRFPKWTITGIEIDVELVALAQLNCEIQQLKIEMREADLRQCPFMQQYDVIVANPPFMRINSGRLSPIPKNNVAKFELACTMDDVFIAIAKGLKSTGIAWLLYSLEREEELMQKLEEYKFKIIKLIKENKVFVIGIEYDTDK